MNRWRPQVKVCGLTRPDQAAACAQLGVDAVGLVFYPPSPRHVAPDRARDIGRAVGTGAWKVGVFVNEDRREVARLAGRCGLDAVQLHGAESAEDVRWLARRGVFVIKALFSARPPGLDQAAAYRDAGAVLAECGRAKGLPGGNAERWNWAEAAGAGAGLPLVLAGGLGPANLRCAVAAALPDAVDASSLLEAAPGIKDLEAVAAFVAAARSCADVYRAAGRRVRPVFGPAGGQRKSL